MMKGESRFIPDGKISADQQSNGLFSGRIPFPGWMISETFRGFQHFFSHSRTYRPSPVDGIGDRRLGAASLPCHIVNCDFSHKASGIVFLAHYIQDRRISNMRHSPCKDDRGFPERAVKRFPLKRVRIAVMIRPSECRHWKAGTPPA